MLMSDEKSSCIPNLILVPEITEIDLPLFVHIINIDKYQVGSVRQGDQSASVSRAEGCN